MLLSLYFYLVLQKPKFTILGVVVVTLCLAWFAQNFRLDASSDSLVVEGDGDLAFSREMNQRYNSGEFVFIAYTPDAELFTLETLAKFQNLEGELLALERVGSIDNMLNVPLLQLATVSLSDIADNILTLMTPGVDLDAARADLLNSDAYKNVLISENGKTASLVVNFEPDLELIELQSRLSELKEKLNSLELSVVERQELSEIEERYVEVNAKNAENLHNDIVQIRAILAQYRVDAEIVMGGVPMIADDLISFVKSDLRNFGLAILIFIIASLAYLFRKLRYVFIPLLCCSASALCVTGLLGYLNWPVTVISSNFLSLLLIITISLTVHLMVRYREIEADGTADNHIERIKLTLKSMIKPCAYTSLTTIVAFGSLVVSDIPPIIDFGLMMVMGVFVAFLVTFLLFPSLLALLNESPSSSTDHSVGISNILAKITEKMGNKIVLLAMMLFVFSVIGISKLNVENSFIDYFDESTEIYQGMVFIDQNLGGTTPLDVIIKMSKANPFGDDAFGDDFDDEFGDEFGDEFDDEFYDEFTTESTPTENAYWFTSDKMQEIIEIHEFLEEIQGVGKVLSLATLIKMAEGLNDDRALNSFELGVLYNSIPEDYKEALLKPYVSVENDQLRFSIRVLETDPELVRSELILSIQQGLENKFDFDSEQVRLTGMLVLYNNMLQSLFESQILTLGLVLSLIMLMFCLLFGSIKLALIGIVPNILAASMVLGLMGWLGIPLDMMTITIAAISIGIGVDNTIHYIHRFKASYPKYNDYRATMKYCHGSIGQAMYFTSFTIVIGFSLLVFSNFIPTIYFGLLISLAMIIALSGSLTLLPQLLITFRPLSNDVNNK